MMKKKHYYIDNNNNNNKKIHKLFSFLEKSISQYSTVAVAAIPLAVGETKCLEKTTWLLLERDNRILQHGSNIFMINGFYGEKTYCKIIEENNNTTLDTK